MPALSSNDVHDLCVMGVEIEKDVHGSIFNFKASALFFLLNYLHNHPAGTRRKQLSATLLRDLVRTAPGADPRSVAISCAALPARSSTFYILIIYLIGTPIRMLATTAPVKSLAAPISLNASPLPLANERVEARLVLSAGEIETLLSGGQLVFGPAS